MLQRSLRVSHSKRPSRSAQHQSPIRDLNRGFPVSNSRSSRSWFWKILKLTLRTRIGLRTYWLATVGLLAWASYFASDSGATERSHDLVITTAQPLRELRIGQLDRQRIALELSDRTHAPAGELLLRSST